MSTEKVNTAKIPAPNPFDPETLRVTGDPNTVGVTKLLLQMPARKPNRQEFFRVNSDPNLKMTAAILEIKEEREIYLVSPGALPLLPNDVRFVELSLCQNRQGILFLWPVPLTGQDGRTNSWHESAREAAILAEKHWIRMIANMSAGSYDIFQAADGIPEPLWPGKSLQDLLALAFKDGKLIASEDHPIIKQLSGR